MSKNNISCDSVPLAKVFYDTINTYKLSSYVTGTPKYNPSQFCKNGHLNQTLLNTICSVLVDSDCMDYVKVIDNVDMSPLNVKYTYVIYNNSKTPNLKFYIILTESHSYVHIGKFEDGVDSFIPQFIVMGEDNEKLVEMINTHVEYNIIKKNESLAKKVHELDNLQGLTMEFKEFNRNFNEVHFMKMVCEKYPNSKVTICSKNDYTVTRTLDLKYFMEYLSFKKYGNTLHVDFVGGLSIDSKNCFTGDRLLTNVDGKNRLTFDNSGITIKII